MRSLVLVWEQDSLAFFIEYMLKTSLLFFPFLPEKEAFTVRIDSIYLFLLALCWVISSLKQ